MTILDEPSHHYLNCYHSSLKLDRCHLLVHLVIVDYLYSIVLYHHMFAEHMSITTLGLKAPASSEKFIKSISVLLREPSLRGL